ncbi:nicotinic acid mononucleotide adenyltransferase [Winogradskyella maritima]|uniref:Toxin-antitoxin system YwqK family antitoxin n=1 Tax=Winogradskyella maritima TaxID=1517766 RepID=A0ABV8AFP8_9FLAO|nr:nicotinic acid mononucleotide adenyltransferase [Winogradskyella maritima]
MKKFITLIAILAVSFSFAQKERSLTLNKKTDLIDVVYYHDNGKISQTGSYTKDGKLHGDWYSYCEEGNKIVSASYENGKKVGKWFYWSGDTLKEVDYSNNVIASINEWTEKTPVATNK